jgi:hypothetical protein
MTPDQIFESFRRASMSSFQLQQEMWKQWTGQLPWTANAAGGSADLIQQLQKRWAEFAGESLDRHRESLDAMYKLAIEAIAQTSHLYESKSPEEYRRGVEEMRTKMFETFKNQSDAQVREFQKTAEKWFDVLVKG